ncbi:hypothetical protein CH274_13280 [Rhodococcus sp. 06-418-5]|nr:hypothetical protein CH274_13280 [Rhodococcus sp. 06-418-5]
MPFCQWEVEPSMWGCSVDLARERITGRFTGEKSRRAGVHSGIEGVWLAALRVDTDTARIPGDAGEVAAKNVGVIRRMFPETRTRLLPADQCDIALLAMQTFAVACRLSDSFDVVEVDEMTPRLAGYNRFEQSPADPLPQHYLCASHVRGSQFQREQFRFLEVDRRRIEYISG